MEEEITHDAPDEARERERENNRYDDGIDDAHDAAGAITDEILKTGSAGQIHISYLRRAPAPSPGYRELSLLTREGRVRRRPSRGAFLWQPLSLTRSLEQSRI